MGGDWLDCRDDQPHGGDAARLGEASGAFGRNRPVRSSRGSSSPLSESYCNAGAVRNLLHHGAKVLDRYRVTVLFGGNSKRPPMQHRRHDLPDEHVARQVCHDYAFVRAFGWPASDDSQVRNIPIIDGQHQFARRTCCRSGVRQVEMGVRHAEHESY
jgi:hypothetical protein